MKCPDCHSEVKFYREYCPRCSASLFGKNKRRTEMNQAAGSKKFWLIAGII
jgi:hypothetical protein